VKVPEGGTATAQDVSETTPVPTTQTATAQAAPLESPASYSIWKLTAEQQTFFDSVAKHSPQQQVQAVRKKLVEVNPNVSEAEIQHVSKDGQLAKFGIRSNAEEIDIWPVRALSNLQHFYYDVLDYRYQPPEIWKHRGLRDLSPLRGLRLRSFQSHGTRIEDLSPLAGMPLSNLNISYIRLLQQTFEDLEFKGQEAGKSSR